MGNHTTTVKKLHRLSAAQRLGRGRICFNYLESGEILIHLFGNKWTKEAVRLRLIKEKCQDKNGNKKPPPFEQGFSRF